MEWAIWTSDRSSWPHERGGGPQGPPLLDSVHPIRRLRTSMPCHRLTSIRPAISVEMPDFRLCLVRRGVTKVPCVSNWSYSLMTDAGAWHRAPCQMTGRRRISLRLRDIEGADEGLPHYGPLITGDSSRPLSQRVHNHRAGDCRGRAGQQGARFCSIQARPRLLDFPRHPRDCQICSLPSPCRRAHRSHSKPESLAHR